MIFIKNKNTDVYFNLAMEEYFFEKFKKDEVFMLWINEPSVVIGKHQNLIEELNMKYCFENNIKIARRLSGGGTVVHDFGNLNYTYITNTTGDTALDFKEFLKPMYNALLNLNIDAHISPRNDFRVLEKKICGHSQFMRKKRVLHHGCILFDSNLNNLRNALNVENKKIISKSAKSVKSSVANLKEISKIDYEISDFLEKLKNEILKTQENFEIYELTKEDILKIDKIKSEKYATKDWIYGQSPKCTFILDEERDYTVEIEGGRIEKINIGYDNKFESLIGLYFEYEEIKNKIDELNIKDDYAQKFIEI
ncbi:lipoate--protein ligase family protein [Parvimonas micra]|uniref:Lipoyltransferase and lipoate-protein ligase n=1 Tax=Parvimonas micra ATCC 33270 TaxID=411465 RepID=A8SM71_9FIRM|nr:biotin/lipoate A/B protein ligase family protein [Parvimonas micra]EDP23420.1 lipoyltransferase and lipoate-protein ligase [Parvimonas micra ATCC 33270]MCK6130538.1 lipoate--protein ligase family protein [Parvimonas micra]MCK6136185.1 lipoate--protein ligase family protein [Parvimonas micra]MCK6137656.1 lipoate--protein ligase family protein [Parvimonas micra]MCK6154184.1 lipoate--protein ligase family protein [Parvimonas micra]